MRDPAEAGQGGQDDCAGPFFSGRAVEWLTAGSYWSSGAAAQNTTPLDDIEIRLQRLERLKEKALLTEAEYQAKREEILGEV